MYSIKTDLHTHTIFSGHAYSTIGENAHEAAKKRLTAIGMTDHFGIISTEMQDNGLPNVGPMMNKAALPKYIEGVRVLHGVEMDIADLKGKLAFTDFYPDFFGHKSEVSFGERLLSTRDLVIASLHFFDGCKDGTVAQNTEMYIGALQNRYVDIIGHPCRPGVEFDMRELARAAKALNKCLEVNDHTFDTPDAVNNCRALAECCAEEGTSIVVSSDAHSAWFIGEFDRAKSMLEEIHFPEELIANRTLESFAALRGKNFD